MKIDGVYEHCYCCREVTPQNKIVENNELTYVCCKCGNSKKRGKIKR